MYKIYSSNDTLDDTSTFVLIVALDVISKPNRTGQFRFNFSVYSLTLKN